MNIDLEDGHSPWRLRMPQTCMLSEDSWPVRGNRYRSRLNIGTLFAFVTAVGSVQSICLDLSAHLDLT